MSHSAQRKSEIDEAEKRARGLIPVTIWIPDVNAPGFEEEYRRQVRLVAEADGQDADLDSFTEAAMRDLAEELDSLEK